MHTHTYTCSINSHASCVERVKVVEVLPAGLDTVTVMS